MPTTLELVLNPEERDSETLLRKKAAQQAGIRPETVSHLEILKVSLDARSRTPVFRMRVDVYGPGELYSPEPAILSGYRPVDGSRGRVLIVGAGPAGYFAALELLEQGVQPIVLDRGKDVRTRRRDLRAIQQFHEVNPHSNYCFGEGGAGTYSDGKLYTRSVKRGNLQKALRLLVEHGAKSDILSEAHPHIGSNKLPGVVQNIRETILHYGGEVHFGQLVTDFILKNGVVQGVRTQTVSPEKKAETTREWLADAVVLATGHSARDIYRLLHARGIAIEAKPFALGVRVEHPQALIDEIQYRQNPRNEHLPAASYSLVCQIRERGVFSFCMCPGGLIVPAATAPGEIVVNGMSMSRRDSPYANSGVVTSVEAEDLKAWEKHGVFAHLEFQAEVERRMFAAGDGSQRGPALRLPDFIAGKLSVDLPGTSYIPGIFPAPLYDLLPPFIYKRLRDGLSRFGQLMRGYYTNEAIVVGTESRSSAPVRIPRDPGTLMHPDVQGLFPCGEGAGYAGGILSAAMDGQRVAQAVCAVVLR
ncbi:MAG: FAD-dependent oxidoreductase [Lewinellaceae bacterium]|nr:FAD-dependent oxidoreductase [Lewinellaceae bacterium]